MYKSIRSNDQESKHFSPYNANDKSINYMIQEPPHQQTSQVVNE